MRPAQYPADSPTDSFREYTCSMSVLEKVSVHAGSFTA